MNRWLIGAGVLLATISVVSNAAALDCSDKRAVAARATAGDQAFAANRYADAMAAYREAYACNRDVSLLFNLAQAQSQAGRNAEAVRSMRAFLEKGATQPADVRKAGEGVLAELLARVATLTVHSDPSGAQVRIGTAVVGVTPLEGHVLEPGTFRLRVLASGHEAYEASGSLAAGEARTVEASLVPTPSVAEPPPPTLDEARGSDAKPAWVWAALGIGSAGVVVGAVTGLVSLSQVADIKERCDGNQCPQDTKAARSEAGTWGNVSNVGFAMGALGLGTGIIGWVVTSRSDGVATVSMSPAGPGLSYGGRF